MIPGVPWTPAAFRVGLGERLGDLMEDVSCLG